VLQEANSRCRATGHVPMHGMPVTGRARERAKIVTIPREGKSDLAHFWDDPPMIEVEADDYAAASSRRRAIICTS
jgi:hypothetical protein